MFDASVELTIRQGLINVIKRAIDPPFLIYASLPEYYSRTDAVKKMVTNGDGGKGVRLATIQFEGMRPSDFGCIENPSFIFSYSTNLFIGNYGEITDNLSQASALKELSERAGRIIKIIADDNLRLPVRGFKISEFVELPTLRKLDTGTDAATGLLGASAEMGFNLEVLK